MTTVQNTATDPGGEPLALISIHITLQTGSANLPGYTGSSDISATYVVATDQTGHWSANLTPNASITPENTYYQVIEGQALSNIVVPSSGGPFYLSELLVAPPASGTPLGITGVQVAADGTVAGVRPEINLIAGTNVTITAADNPGAGRVDVTVNATGGGGGGAVSSVFDRAGNVVAQTGDYSADQISGLGTAATEDADAFDAAGSAATAQANAETFTTGAVAVETARAEAAETTKLTIADNLSDLTDQSAARGHLGLGSSATQNTAAFDPAGAASTAQSNAIATAEANAAATYVPLSALPLPITSGGTGAGTASGARTALGLGSAATQDTSAFDAAGAASTAQANAISAAESSAASTYVALSSLPLAIASGGTGQASAQAALDALAGGTTSGQYLRGNGTHVALSAIQAGDLPSAAYQFSVLAYGAKGDGKASNTGATTASSTTVTIAEPVLTSGDIGKSVLVKNALNVNNASGQTTSVGTITAVPTSTSFTATWNTTPTQTTTGLQVLWATDDTMAIQAAIAAANTYAQNHMGYGEIYFPPGAGLYYGVGGPLKSTDGVNAVYNSQLTIPITAEQAAGVTLVFRGPEDAGQPRYWNADYPTWNGCIQSFGCFTSSGTQSASITGGGNPSVIGGPTGKNGYGVLQGANTTPTYTNTCVVFQDFTIRTTHVNSGWTYCPYNFFGVARLHARNFTCGTNGLVQFYKNGPGLGDYANVTLLSGGLSIGGIMPSNGNNASNYLSNYVCDGGYTFGLFAMEHTVGNSVTILYCWGGVCPVGNYADSGSNAVSALHAIEIDQACVEGCTYALDIVGAGQSGIGPIIHMVLDTEGTVQLRDAVGGTLANTGAALAAALGEVRLVGSPSAITVSTGTGAGGLGTGLRIIKEQNLPGVPSSGIPTLVDGTAVSNTLWRPATVYLSGGTNVTTVAVSRLAGGVNTVAVTTVISQAAGPIAANTPIRLGPGQWIKVTTATGTLPTAVWVLD